MGSSTELDQLYDASYRRETLIAELDLAEVAAARRFMDPTGHYNRPDIFRLLVDTTSRQATTATGLSPNDGTHTDDVP